MKISTVSVEKIRTILLFSFMFYVFSPQFEAQAQGVSIDYVQHDPSINGIFKYPWRKIEAERRQIIFGLGWIDGKHSVDQDTAIYIASLPFYDNVEMIYVKNSKWTDKNLYIYFLIDRNNSIFRLNGTSAPIHAVNGSGALNVTEHNVREYVWFFCFFVRGEDGPFLVAESASDTFVPKNISFAVLDVFQKTFKPMQLSKKFGNGDFEVKAILFYSNAVFLADMLVKKSGMVEMKNDSPLIKDLPVKVTAPIS